MQRVDHLEKSVEIKFERRNCLTIMFVCSFPFLPAIRFPSLYFIFFIAVAAAAGTGPGFGGVFTIRPLYSRVLEISNVCKIVSVSGSAVILRTIGAGVVILCWIVMLMLLSKASLIFSDESTSMNL